MPRLDFVIETKVSRSPRARQLEGMFDVPPEEKQRLEWHGEVPLEEKPWNVGLIVGPSGSGKTSIARQLFGNALDSDLPWKGKSVIDSFGKAHSMEAIAQVCSAVGFNTIPAWLRPYEALSNGEKFRVTIARRLLDSPDPIVMDEFTSVVDRQVAKIGAHAVQKYVRTHSRRFVAVSCHYDIVDWLQPDWILEPATMAFTWRSLQRRPKLEVSICRVPFEAWMLFAPFHYLTRDLHRGARCFGLFVGERIASFAGVLYRPHPHRTNLMGVSRAVTLPDWQGLGLSFILCDALGAAYKAVGKVLHHYPAHPSFIRAFDRSPKWALKKRPGVFSRPNKIRPGASFRFTGRPCAVFEYVGEAMEASAAKAFLETAA